MQMKPECELGLWSLHREEHTQKPKGNLFQYSNTVIQFRQKVKFQSVFIVSLFLSLSLTWKHPGIFRSESRSLFNRTNYFFC